MQLRTGFQGSSVKFSPYEDGRIAVGTAQNFGIIGNGKQHVFQVSFMTCLVTNAARGLGRQDRSSSVLSRLNLSNCRTPVQGQAASPPCAAHLPTRTAVQFGAQGPAPLAEYDTKDGICDCGWCEVGALLLEPANLPRQQWHLLRTFRWQAAFLAARDPALHGDGTAQPPAAPWPAFMSRVIAGVMQLMHTSLTLWLQPAMCHL